MKRPRMPPLERKIGARLVGVEIAGPGLTVLYVPLRGATRELPDPIQFGPAGSLAAVRGVGRFLRLLRAGRIRAPADPYAMAADLECARALVARCLGAKVTLGVRRHLERSLTLWTDSGVERIERVIDFLENPEGLAIRCRGGHSQRRVPRQNLIRYLASTEESLEIISVEPVGPGLNRPE